MYLWLETHRVSSPICPRVKVVVAVVVIWHGVDVLAKEGVVVVVFLAVCGGVGDVALLPRCW